MHAILCKLFQTVYYDCTVQTLSVTWWTVRGRVTDLITISCALLVGRGVATPVSDCRKVPFGLSHRSRYPLFSWGMGSVTKSHLHFEHLLAWCGAENMGPICQFGAQLIRKYCWSFKGFLSMSVHSEFILIFNTFKIFKNGVYNCNKHGNTRLKTWFENYKG